MISRIIEFSIRNRYLVILVWLGVAAWGVYAVLHTPVDAIPDLSENQVIVFTDWMGRSPQDIEDQITYPLSVQLQGLAGVKAVRSSSEFNFSMINVIFDDHTDYYFARTRVLERLSVAKSQLPPDVTPYMAPDATALGQIFWYTVEGGGKSLDELRAIQDFTVKYQLNSVPGVAEASSVGGFVREYQVDIDPNKLRVFALPLGAVYSAIAQSNMSVGGKVVVQNSSEYLIRGIGWLRGATDLENVVVASRGGVPITLRQLATVQLGPEFRRSALEKDGREAVGGVVMMRFGENPLSVTQAIKEKIRKLQAGLPQGVRIVPFYDRTYLIHSAIHTVTGTLKEEMVIASIAILLILVAVRSWRSFGAIAGGFATGLGSALVVCVTLPMAVLVSFLFMYYLKLPSNIMSLSGIAISIGILVDASVVMVENATHELKLKFGDEPVRGDTTEVVVKACRLVGTPIFFSVLIMLISFLPVFAFGGQEGKLTHPLAFTKSFAMVGVSLLAITLVPAMIPILIRGRLSGEEENWIVRSFIGIYKPVLSAVVDRPGIVWWMMAVILALGSSLIGAAWVTRLTLALGLLAIIVFVRQRRALALLSLVAMTLLGDSCFRKLGTEFMPELDEGSIMDMPTTAPRIAMGQAVDDVMVRDRLLQSFPEVEQAVGKIGRADTATDPSPTDMVETIVSLRPRDWWPKRRIEFGDALKHAAAVAARMQERGWIKADSLKGETWATAADAVTNSDLLRRKPWLGAASDVLNMATQDAVDRFDRTLRELARRRQIEYQPQLARAISSQILNDVLDHLRAHPTPGAERYATPRISDADRAAILDAVQERALFLSLLPRQEEVDKLLTDLRNELVKRRLAPDRDDLLLDHPNRAAAAWQAIRRAVGAEPPTLAEREMRAVEQLRDQLWQAHARTLNWELFDTGTRTLNDELLQALHHHAAGTPLAGTEPKKEEVARLSAALTPPLGKRLFLWQKTRADLVKEMDSELQMPGWGNAWTQPIINRVNMLATGVRTQIGVKVFGPTGKPLGGEDGAIADVQRVSEEVAARLRKIPGQADVVADQSLGKRYIEISIDRAKAARYGVNMTELSEAIETALGGNRVTMTVEGRERFPVRLRYARAHWQDIDSIRNTLVTGNTTAARTLASQFRPGLVASATMAPAMSEAKSGAGGMGSGMGGGSSSPRPATAAPISGTAGSGAAEAMSVEPPAGPVMIPLGAVADVRVTEGPSMIKSENGRLRNYVTLNVRGRDLLGFVEEAKAAIKPIEAKLAGTGMTIEWAGEFENVARMWQTMVIILPMSIVLIAFLLYMTFRHIIEVLLVFLAVLGAWAGGVMFQSLFGFNFSVIVWIGYVAALGMATQTGVIMLVYLREAIDRHGGLAGMPDLETLRRAVIEGAVHRLRPKLLTEGVAIVGLVPMLWATGTGAEIMRPMAAPVLGGLLISDEVIDLMIPVLFYRLARRRWMKLHGGAAAAVNPREVEPIAVGVG